MKHYRFIFITALLLLIALALYPIPAHTQTPTPPPTATPTFTEKHEEIFLNEIIAPIVVLVVGAILGTIATILFKPSIDRWVEHQKLRLKAKDDQRKAKKRASNRRSIEDKRLRTYLERIIQTYNYTRVVGQTGTIPLSDIYTDVYILGRPQATRRLDISLFQADYQSVRSAKYSERRHGLSLLEHNRRIFILGQPGAGKTTFLRYLACHAAKGTINKIPIFVTLRDWADTGGDLLPYIYKQFDLLNYPNAQVYVKYLLNETDMALVLFDGLDEVTQTAKLGRAQVINTLREFADRFQRAQILITCRVAATEYNFDKFTYVEIADFTENQISTYVKKWFRHSNKKEQLFLNELQKPEHRGLHELARTPLLLGLLCLSFDETMNFPTRRVSLYTEALDALLKKWDSERDVQRDY